MYWLRDACRVYHTWLNESSPYLPRARTPLDDTKLLRAQVDDSVYARIRSQQVVGLAGNVFTGGFKEAVFDIYVGKIVDLGYRTGSPAADIFTLESELMGSLVAARLEDPGGSFCAASLQYRALRAGARLGRSISGGTVPSRASTFWNEEQGFMTETTVTDVMRWGRSGKGSVPITVSVLNFDPTLGCDPATFQPCSDRALSNLKVIGDAFPKIFPPDEPRFDQNVEVGTYRKGSDVYENLTDAITNWAERALLLAEIARLATMSSLWPWIKKLRSLLVAALDMWWDHGGRFHQESRGGAGWWGWWDVWSGIEGQFNVGL
ncbi:hypothetical protein EDB85DRAFT_1895958 [Lactarius pseudohatsudake]|nr:hypothetical protein EDB85DRAFT_1895958 [Lactarius pseudohatsudake]